jgi:hypothetical protein
MKKHLTLMVIPHNESHVKELHLSRSVLWGIFSGLIFFIGLFIFYTVGYYLNQGKESQRVALKIENTEMKHQFTLVQERLNNFRHKVDALTDQDRRMRAWVDLSEPGDEVRKMGVGGGEDADPEWEGRVSGEVSHIFSETFTSLDQLVREARFVEASFDTIVSKLKQDDHTRNHTPSISPVQGKWYLSSGFGSRKDPFTGRQQIHNGVDLAGWPRTPIVATADGTIAKVTADKRLGNYVKIDHNNGLYTLYGHLHSKPNLKIGSKVKRGDKIGEMGATGRATATHVHYTVIRNGRALQPFNYIFDDPNRSSLY